MSLVGTPATIDGRYLPGRLLGRGGMARVYRATDSVTGGAVAVKIFDLAVDADALVRQQRETAVAASLNHPGIVRLLDHGCVDAAGMRITQDTDEHALVFLVTELVDGPTLREKMARQPLTPDQVALVGARLAESIAYLHRRGVVHRDIKPANILLPGYGDDALGEAKLADFGVAILIDDTRVTTDGQVVGTPNYLSPEQVSGAKLVTGSDVYSLGLVLIEALTGTQSFPGTGVETALARLHRVPAIPLDTPPWLASVLAAMTSLRAEDRPPADEVALQLRTRDVVTLAPTAVLPNLEVSPIPAVEPVPALPDDPTPIDVDDASRPDRLWWAVVAAAIVALVGVIGAASATSGSSKLPVPSPSSSASRVAQPLPSTSASPSTAKTTPPALVAAKTTKAVVPAPNAAPKPAPKPHRHGHGHGPGH